MRGLSGGIVAGWPSEVRKAASLAVRNCSQSASLVMFCHSALLRRLDCRRRCSTSWSSIRTAASRSCVDRTVASNCLSPADRFSWHGDQVSTE